MTNNANSNRKTPPRGMVFYPREYVVNPDPAQSYANGVDRRGNPCRVYVIPTVDPSTFTSSGQTLPTIAMFSDVSRKAQHPCYAEEDNGPENPAGVMLLEQVETREPEQGAERVFVGRWASVLCETREDLRPAIGVGYLEVNFKPNDLVNLADLVNELNQKNQDLNNGVGDRLDLIERRDYLAQEILRRRSKFFTAVLLNTDHMQTLDVSSKQASFGQLAGILNRYTKRGVFGGVIVRPRVPGQLIDPGLCSQIDMRYDTASGGNLPVEKALEGFFKYSYNKLLRAMQQGNMEVDLIPLTRINAGKVAAESLSKTFVKNSPDGRVVPDSKFLTHYIDKSRRVDPLTNYRKPHDYLCSHIAVRTATVRNGAGAGNIIMGSIHSYSPVIGKPLEMGPSGKREHQLPMTDAAPRQAQHGLAPT